MNPRVYINRFIIGLVVLLILYTVGIICLYKLLSEY